MSETDDRKVDYGSGSETISEAFGTVKLPDGRVMTGAEFVEMRQAEIAQRKREAAAPDIALTAMMNADQEEKRRRGRALEKDFE